MDNKENWIDRQENQCLEYLNRFKDTINFGDMNIWDFKSFLISKGYGQNLPQFRILRIYKKITGKTIVEKSCSDEFHRLNNPNDEDVLYTYFEEKNN